MFCYHRKLWGYGWAIKRRINQWGLGWSSRWVRTRQPLGCWWKCRGQWDGCRIDWRYCPHCLHHLYLSDINARVFPTSREGFSRETRVPVQIRFLSKQSLDSVVRQLCALLWSPRWLTINTINYPLIILINDINYLLKGRHVIYFWKPCNPSFAWMMKTIKIGKKSPPLPKNIKKNENFQILC